MVISDLDKRLNALAKAIYSIEWTKDVALNAFKDVIPMNEKDLNRLKQLNDEAIERAKNSKGNLRALEAHRPIYDEEWEKFNESYDKDD